MALTAPAFVGLGYLDDQVLPRRQVPWYCVKIPPVFGSPCTF
jgi:hypothetical protein